MILTLASPRTVSTRIHTILCDYYNVTNLQEAFNYFNFKNLYKEQAREQQLELYQPVPSQWHKKQLLKILTDHTKVGVKIFPGHLNRIPWIFEELIENAKIIESVVIIRKDVNAQINSWYRARYTGHWGYKDSYPTTIHIPWDQTKYDRLKITILDNYKTLAKWQKQIPNCKWMWSEDAMSGEPQHQPHTLERELPLITENHLKDFDLTSAQQFDFSSIVTQTSHLAHP